MQSITNKLKYKLKLLMFMVAIVLSITAIHQLQKPITTYADNAGGEGEGGGSAEDSGGASEGKCGFRMYVVDYNGNLKSKVIDLVSASPSYHGNAVTTRIGGGSATERWQMPPDMPRPYFHSGTFIGNGQAVKQWMRSKGDNGKQHIMNIIATYLGDDVAALFEDKSVEHYLVLESIAFHNIYTGNSATTNTGSCFYGTFYNWMELYSKLGLPDGGYTKQLDNNVLARCLELEYDQPNLGLSFPATGDLVTMANLGNQGFGIQLYSNLDQSGTHTWDYPKGDTPAQAPPSNGKMNIVKNYRTETAPNTYTDDGCFTRTLTDSTIMIEDEETYTVVAWKITNTTSTIDSITWNPPGTVAEEGKTPKTVTIKKPSTTLYVLLQKTELEAPEVEDADYTLAESQITRAISLKTDDENDKILQDKKFKWNFGSLATCPGHTYNTACAGHGHSDDCGTDCSSSHNCGTNCVSNTATCTTFTLSDTAWNFKLKNDKRADYSKNIAYNSYWTDYVSEQTGTRTSTDSGNIEKEFDYKCVLHRGSDTLSIAEWKNTNEALNSLDNFNTVNSKSPSRKRQDYTESVTFDFQDDSSDKTTTSTGTTGVEGVTGCSLSDEASLDATFSTDVTILYKTYSGNQSGGKLNTEINTSEMLTIGSTGNKIVSGRMVNSGLQFSYHPYIKMRYDTMTSAGAITKDTKINILGEYLRSMKLNDYAEIEWTKPTSENMVLSSPQWSTHATPKSDLGSTDCLLPGGASMTLGIKKANRQTVTVRTYQCILDGDGRTQVEKTWKTVSGYTKQTALDYHTAYTNSVKKGLENLSVEQWQNKSYTSDPFSGIIVYNEADISSLKNGASDASYEDKYYFKNERGTAQSGCLDVQVGTTNTVYYVFKSDTSGNIYMNGTKILTKDQGVESLSGTALAINSRTLVVTKLLDSIERNTGNDTGASWVTDGKWYNEAMDGVTVAVSTTKLTTGYIDPSERTTILDPRLNVKGTGQSTLFSGYMVGQFKMRDYSAAYGVKNMIGQFKGSAILMKDMDRLYYTKKFYLSNITVQDLH